jgi:capsular polysaccharide export protein
MASELEAVARFREMPKVLYVYRFPYWKWPVVRQCFPGRRIVFIEQVDAVPSGSWLLLWGMCPVPDGLSQDVRVLRLEDGFLRSVGLGADLVKPLSWIVDGAGIYYDATRPSDLELLFATSTFDEVLISRAANLRSSIVAAGLTKYNVGQAVWLRPHYASKVILVPGQVESDASIAYGAAAISTNMELLLAVRDANPDAYLVYKPHPDVQARLRAVGRGEEEAYRWCDEVVTNVPMGDLLREVDEVHVLTSLAGFEALLRGKSVTCYGQPFYSGWGLTHDLVPNARRSRSLTLDELVAVTLIKYPLYLSRDGKKLITPEQALDELSSWYARSGGGTPWWREIIRIFLRRIVGVR